jgi:hypothetical protein
MNERMRDAQDSFHTHRQQEEALDFVFLLYSLEGIFSVRMPVCVCVLIDSTHATEADAVRRVCSQEAHRKQANVKDVVVGKPS